MKTEQTPVHEKEEGKEEEEEKEKEEKEEGKEEEGEVQKQSSGSGSAAADNAPLAEVRTIGALDLQLYLAYFAQANARVPGAAALGGALFAVALAEAARVTSDWWLSRWAGDGTLPGDAAAPPAAPRSTQFWLATYGAWAVAVALLALGRSLVFVRAALGAAVRMHDRLLARVLSASCASFFDVTPMGQLLSCFSKDLDSVDMMLSQFLHDFMQVRACGIPLRCGALATHCCLLPFIVSRGFHTKLARISPADAVALCCV